MEPDDEIRSELSDREVENLSRLKENMQVEFESEMKVGREDDTGISLCPHRDANGSILPACDHFSHLHVIIQTMDQLLGTTAACHIDHPVLSERLLETVGLMAEQMVDQIQSMRFVLLGRD